MDARAEAAPVSCLRRGRLPLTHRPPPSKLHLVFPGQGAHRGPCYRTWGAGHFVLQTVRRQLSRVLPLHQPLPDSSHAELRPTWVFPKASFPDPQTTGSPFFPALGRPASSHCGTACCCSQAAAPVPGAGTDHSGAWEQARPVPSPREEEELAQVPFAETALQGHLLHPQALNVTGHQASVHTALTDHTVMPPNERICYRPLPDLHPQARCQPAAPCLKGDTPKSHYPLGIRAPPTPPPFHTCPSDSQ